MFTTILQSNDFLHCTFGLFINTKGLEMRVFILIKSHKMLNMNINIKNLEINKKMRSTINFTYRYTKKKRRNWGAFLKDSDNLFTVHIIINSVYFAIF